MKRNRNFRKRMRSNETSISSLHLTFILRMMWIAIATFFYKVWKTIPLIFTEIARDIRKTSWKWWLRVDFEKDRLGYRKDWRIKFIFFILIFDIDWNKSYIGAISGKKYEACLRIHLWVCSWKIAKLWRHEGTNVATIFVLDSNQSFRAFRRWLKRINPYNILKRVAVLQAIEDTNRVYSDICDDPMCGCPGDFAEEGDRQVNKLWAEYNNYKYCF